MSQMLFEHFRQPEEEHRSIQCFPKRRNPVGRRSYSFRSSIRSSLRSRYGRLIHWRTNRSQMYKFYKNSFQMLLLVGNYPRQYKERIFLRRGSSQEGIFCTQLCFCKKSWQAVFASIGTFRVIAVFSSDKATGSHNDLPGVDARNTFIFICGQIETRC